MTRINIKLGTIVRDKVTGFQGMAINRYQYLNGCERYCVQPTELKDGKPVESETFDVEQLEIVKKSKAKKPSETGGPQPEPTQRPEG